MNLSANPIIDFPKSIGNLVNLEELEMSYCRLKNKRSLENIPAEIGNLRKLKKLTISGNYLNNIPKEIGNLSELEYFDAGDNLLDSVPESLFLLKKLKELKLNKNHIRTVHDLRGLTELRNIDVSFNELSVLPDGLDKLNHLVFIAYTNNPAIDDSKPNILKNLPGINAHQKNYETLPEYIYQNKNRSALNLDNTRIKILNKDLEKLDMLEILHLHNCSLSHIDVDFSKFKNLYYIDLSENEDLSLADLCKALSKVEKPIYLYTYMGFPNPEFEINMDSSRLLINLSGMTCTIPKEIGLIKNLVYLDLSSSGVKEIPIEIGENQNLETLVLSQNKITAIPKELGELKKLKKLELSGNQISALPSELGNLKNLEELFASWNHIKNVPNSFCKLESLQTLKMDRNDLESIEGICGLEKLRELELSENKIGYLPHGIGKLKSLSKLDLFRNKIKTLPSEIGQLTSLKELKLTFNEIVSLPPEIGNLKALTILDLSINKLVKLPNEIRKLQKLKELHIAENNFNKVYQEKIQKWLPYCRVFFVDVLEFGT